MKDIHELRVEFCFRQGGICEMCPLSIYNNGHKLVCTLFCDDFPDEAMIILNEENMADEEIISESDFKSILHI